MLWLLKHVLNLFSLQETLEESLVGEVRRGGMWAQFEAQDMWVLQYLYFQRDVLLVLEQRKGGR